MAFISPPARPKVKADAVRLRHAGTERCALPVALEGVGVSLEGMDEHVDPTAALSVVWRSPKPGVLLAVGPVGCGKTTFAIQALDEAMALFGGQNAVMTVQNRVLADTIGNEVIRHQGALGQARPVTTLPATAFRVIETHRRLHRLTPARLLDGAQQDALLRAVVAVHLAHAQAGETCGTCALLRDYFAVDDWSATVVDLDTADAAAASGDGTSAVLFARGVSGAFVAQLRDILARLDELGVEDDDEKRLLGDIPADHARLGMQWRLAFALRDEYRRAVEREYPDEYRLDAARLLVEGAAVLRDGEMTVNGESHGLPAALVVDDFQDTTLAGLRFLEALAAKGVRLVLVGNPDESVQSFRGAHPEYLFEQARMGALRARLTRLGVEEETGGGVAPDYRSALISRISLSIPSMRPDPLPLPQRPGKSPRYEGTLPISALPGDSPLMADGSVRAGLYRSAREEMDDIAWRMKRARLDGHARWNDMALIAHDNTTVRLYGERLRRDGVPVRYSSITRPLKAEPFVQGLFALIELALLRKRGARGKGPRLAALAAYVRPRVRALFTSGLVTSGAKPGQGVTGRIEPIESAMTALESLVQVAAQNQPQDEAGSGAGGRIGALAQAWQALRNDVVRSRDEEDAPTQPVDVDEHLVDPLAVIGDGLEFGRDALYAMLALDDALAPGAQAMEAIAAVLGKDPQAKAFARLWHLVDTVSRGMGRLASPAPQHMLALAWDACGVARPWQTLALRNTPEGRAANDRLDAAMRLFQFAQSNAAGRDIADFIAQVRSMQIEADSLAHVGPVEDAVTLTTPAGAAGRRWAQVWLPAIQQDVWPNLAERNALFSGEELAGMVLDGRLAGQEDGHDPIVASVLAGERKSLLVAASRASQTLHVSAVWNDDLTPSDFLFAYLPECFIRDREHAAFTPVAADAHESLAGLDADPRGLVAAARLALVGTQDADAEEESKEGDGARTEADHTERSRRSDDAARTLAVLAEHGVSCADPANWNFPAQADPSTVPSDGKERTVVSLSPSSVDSLWACPVCWLLENRFAGPRPSSVATGFGSLIHQVACLGSEEGLDLPDARAEDGVESRVETVTARLQALYDQNKPDLAAVDDVAKRYAAMRKDQSAPAVLANIASYFVRSNEPGYLAGNAKFFETGILERAVCEEELAARFDLGDILAACRGVSGLDGIDRDTLMAFMGWLVGGWPEGMEPGLTVRLSGRIDRREERRLSDGSVVMRLIDYKTGAKPSTLQIVNDLQLVCYQLMLAFPEGAGRGAEALGKAPRITQSMLFHVSELDAPAQSYAPESLHQTALFVDGRLNTKAFTPRFHYQDPLKLLDMPAMPEQAPEGFDQKTWERWRTGLNGTQALWALTMIARVFHTAASSRSTMLIARPTAEHLAHCRMASVCPACGGQVSTVFETRLA